MNSVHFSLSRILCLLIVIATFGVLTPHAQAQGLNFAYINLEEVFTQTDDYVQAFNELKRIKQSTTDKLKQRDMELKNEFYELEVEKELMPEDSIKQKQEELQKEVEEFRSMMENEQKDFAQQRDQRLQDLNQKLKQVIETIAKQENISMVFRFKDLLYADPALDITSKVIDAMNN